MEDKAKEQKDKDKDQEQIEQEQEFTIELSDKFCGHKGDFTIRDKNGNILIG